MDYSWKVVFFNLRMRRKGDILLMGAIIILAVVGLIMISSVSVFESNNLTFEIEGKNILREHYANGESDFESEAQINKLSLSAVKANLTPQEQKKVNGLARNDFYFWRHLEHLVVGLLVFFLMAKIPYYTWRRFAFPIFVVAIVLLMLVLTHIGADYGTARSWINLPGLPSIQPSEFAKLALILYLSSWLDQREDEVATFNYGFLPFLGVMGLVSLLIVLQPDLGSLLVMFLISTSIYYVAGANTAHLAMGALVGGGLALPAMMSMDYVQKRFMAFWDPASDTLGIGYQILNSLVAVGSGGFLGAGFGKSVQKFGYLPEVQSDSIFPAICEEAGFLKMLIFLGLFVVIAWRGYLVAENTTDRFGKLLAVGITSWIIFQATINIAVNLALIPNTGITLPFISYGGSSLIMTLAAGGILVNISKGSNNKSSYESFGNRRRVGRSRISRISSSRISL